MGRARERGVNESIESRAGSELFMPQAAPSSLGLGLHDNDDEHHVLLALAPNQHRPAPLHLYLLQRIIYHPQPYPANLRPSSKSGYSWMPRAHPPTLLFTTYTPRTLTRFDGKDGGRILLAIAGTVFDVTAGRGFYGPGKHAPWTRVS
jgi:hypothetical protein